MVQFVFGYGVGGEYPMAAGSAAERAEAGGKKAAAARGQEVNPLSTSALYESNTLGIWFDVLK